MASSVESLNLVTEIINNGFSNRNSNSSHKHLMGASFLQGWVRFK